MTLPVAANSEIRRNRIYHEGHFGGVKCNGYFCLADEGACTGGRFADRHRRYMKVESVTFKDENNMDQEFYVVEQTRVNGTNYLLVADSPEGDAEALILKDISDVGSEEAEYVPVEDDALLEALMKIFAELMEDDVEIRL